MSKALEEIALRKQMLQARSALCRVEIESGLQALGASIPWLGIGPKAAEPEPLWAWLAGTALRRLAGGGLGRGLAFTTGALLAVKVARLVIGLFTRSAAAPGAGES